MYAQPYLSAVRSAHPPTKGPSGAGWDSSAVASNLRRPQAALTSQ